MNDSIAYELIKDQPENGNMPTEMIVFSHLRWDFVYQRPQHLLTRLAYKMRITFIEEPIHDAENEAYYSVVKKNHNIYVMVPHVRHAIDEPERNKAIKKLFTTYIQTLEKEKYAFWYYTPMALEFSRPFTPQLVIYDCMDELSAFKFAPESLKLLEQELLAISSVVFTGGYSLYEAKKNQHHNIHAFPSAIEKAHFALTRTIEKHKTGNKPILGFYGVIDERFDIDLIAAIAEQRPEWKIELIGPVVKIDPKTLPANKNIIYTGPKSYQELPQCMASWDVALIPFLLNESTRFISPTKTPEYLAAGLPVVSTAITDVVNPYGDQQLVSIAHNAGEFIVEIEKLINMPLQEKTLLTSKVDAFLSNISWDKTTDEMYTLMTAALKNKYYEQILESNV